MYKSEKGISLITGIVTIIIIIILVSIIIGSSIDSVAETNMIKIENEIKDLKVAVNTRIINNESNNAMHPLIGKKIGDSVFEYIRSIETLSSEQCEKIIQKLLKNYSEENSDYYRLVGRIDAEKLGVTGIDREHYYIVDYYECEVYGPIKLNGGENDEK